MTADEFVNAYHAKNHGLSWLPDQPRLFNIGPYNGVVTQTTRTCLRLSLQVDTRHVVCDVRIVATKDGVTMVTEWVAEPDATAMKIRLYG